MYRAGFVEFISHEIQPTLSNRNVTAEKNSSYTRFTHNDGQSDQVGSASPRVDNDSGIPSLQQ
jgi:hypothetical protein